MIIQKKESPSCVKFRAIEEGEAFRAVGCNSNILWMKTRHITSDYNDDYNAVDLSDGDLDFFKEDELVTPVRVTVVEE